jgi:hypothetical protein
LVAAILTPLQRWIAATRASLEAIFAVRI